MHPHNPNDPLDQVEDVILGWPGLVAVGTTGLGLAIGLVLTLIQAFGG